MPKTTTVQQVQQPDLFGGPAVTVGVVAPPAPRRAPRKVHETQVAAHRQITDKRTDKGPTADERCRWDIAGNSKLGRTRQEIANRTGIKLQTVCGCVDRLLKAGRVIEPVIGYTENHRPIHYVRDGGKVVVDALFTDFDWMRFGQALDRERTSAA